MKKWILISIITFFPLFCLAEEENRTSGNDCGEHCSWKIEDGVLTLTGYGAMKNFGHKENGGSYAPWYWNQENITKVVIENQSADEKFTNIGSGSFERMNKVQEIVLPDGIEKIGQMACYGCNSLEKINLPNSLKIIEDWAFGQSKLSQIDIPEGIEKIHRYAFQLTDLTSVVIPENTDLDINAFFNDSGIATADSTPIITIYCAKKNMAQCQAAVSYRNGNAKILEYQKTEDGQYFVNNKWYQNLNDILSGNHTKKRIYTVEEATKVSKPTGNTFTIRYK